MCTHTQVCLHVRDVSGMCGSHLWECMCLHVKSWGSPRPALRGRLRWLAERLKPTIAHDSFLPSAPSSLQEEEMPMKQVQD